MILLFFCFVIFAVFFGFVIFVVVLILLFFIVVVVIVVEIHVSVNCIKMLGVAQQCSYGKFISPETMQIIRTNFLKKSYSN